MFKSRYWPFFVVDPKPFTTVTNVFWPSCTVFRFFRCTSPRTLTLSHFVNLYFFFIPIPPCISSCQLTMSWRSHFASLTTSLMTIHPVCSRRPPPLALELKACLQPICYPSLLRDKVVLPASTFDSFFRMFFPRLFVLSSCAVFPQTTPG